jgi:hypothetical protein
MAWNLKKRGETMLLGSLKPLESEYDNNQFPEDLVFHSVSLFS